MLMGLRIKGGVQENELSLYNIKPIERSQFFLSIAMSETACPKSQKCVAVFHPGFRANTFRILTLGTVQKNGFQQSKHTGSISSLIKGTDGIIGSWNQEGKRQFSSECTTPFRSVPLSEKSLLTKFKLTRYALLYSLNIGFLLSIHFISQ